MEKYSYLTIEKSSEGIYKEKGSRFLSFAFHVKDEQEIKKIIDLLRKKYHDARHHCYAWKIGTEIPHIRANDDGEPANSAGKPILAQIESFQLTNVLVVVVRYFGGKLLGVGGLIHAYKTASHEALKNAKIIEQYVYDIFSMRFEYPDTNEVMNRLKAMNYEYFDAIFEEKSELKARVPRGQSSKFRQAFNQHPNIKIERIAWNEKLSGKY